jgi:hypothetical protein
MQPVRREETSQDDAVSFLGKVKQPVLDCRSLVDEGAFDGNKLRLLPDFSRMPVRNVAGSRTCPSAFRAAKIAFSGIRE